MQRCVTSMTNPVQPLQDPQNALRISLRPIYTCIIIHVYTLCISSFSCSFNVYKYKQYMNFYWILINYFLYIQPTHP